MSRITHRIDPLSLILAMALVGCGDASATDGGGDTAVDTGSSSSGGPSTGIDSTTTPSTSGGPGMTDSATDTAGTTGTIGTTGGSPCASAEDCTDPDALFCGPRGTCVPCDGTDNPDAACAEADADAPVCDQGDCVQCTEDKAAACEGATPVCGADSQCRACDEHFECPDSACHLDGPDQGACFDVGDVVDVADGPQLESELGNLTGGDRAVLVLTGTEYNGVEAEVLSDVEVAIIGRGNAEISGNTGSGLLSSAGNAIMYIAGVVVRSNGSGDGIACSGTSVWVDDARIRNNAQTGLDISAGCEGHLRRTSIHENSAIGIDVSNGSAAYLSRTTVRDNDAGGISGNDAQLYIRNSAIAANGGNLSNLGGLSLADASVYMTYTSIVANDAQMSSRMSMYCTGATSGTVRNGIIVASAASVDACGGVTFESSAVDTAGLGVSNQDVGTLDPGWFVAPDTGDVHLTVSGETIFMDIAQWQAGDPVTDVDGDPIVTNMPSFPGYDQP